MKQSWWMLKDQVLFKYAAINDVTPEKTIPILGWKLETLPDVS